MGLIHRREESRQISKLKRSVGKMAEEGKENKEQEKKEQERRIQENAPKTFLKVILGIVF